jgi:pimeloyl-ACP methyl ester carboxylesterase
MSEPTTHTVNAPGATIYYDVREAEGQNGAPPLMMIASPMDAGAFATLVGHFPDRTVVTYDPRGAARSKRTDGAEQTTPEEHADDLHRVIEALGTGPVDLFASSGGAVNALALVAQHPDDVRTLVAHEPPAAQVLPDREEAMAAATGIHETYLCDGLGPAMAKFIVLVSLKGPVPAGFGDHPAPNPAQFGLPTEDDGRRDDALVGQNIVSSTHYEHDFDSLRAASTRVVIAAGVESEGELAHRAALAVAERLGTEPAIFPSGHGGFLGGEYGQTGDPDAFAAKLREVLGE